MIKNLLIANRGEIAVRIIRACRAMGIASTALYSEPDANALHVRMADGAVPLQGSTARESYLDIAAVVEAARAAGADAVHPGYGFLAENADFAEAVVAAGLTWVGPPAEAIRVMGDKVSARAAAARAGVHGVPGTDGPVETAEEVLAFAAQHGFPVVIKAAAGGGGRGMRVVSSEAEVSDALASARREAGVSFGSESVYVERYLESPRHVEVQVLFDQHGNHLALGERDCSVQRRHQKLVEEAPAPSVPSEVRSRMAEAGIAVAAAVDYVGAGTIEFLLEGEAFYFLEMNTRLQVEHPVTELVYGVDLVAEQLRIAAGEALALDDLAPRGHAIECRINAEDPAGGQFIPQPGDLERLWAPTGPGIRFDTGYVAGDTIPPFYDNLIGKLIAWGRDRDAARRAIIAALQELVVVGVPTSASAQLDILEHPDFVAVSHTTRWLETEEIVQSSALDRTVSAAIGPVESQQDDDVTPAGATEEAVYVAGRRYWVPTGRPQPEAAAVDAPRDHGRPARSQARRDPPASATGRSSSQKRSAQPSGAVLSPMQGTIASVTVAVGDLVDPGAVLFVVEAMKMENQIVAQRSGTVSKVHASAGQSVGSGEVLAVID